MNIRKVIDKKNCYAAGAVIKTHGAQGEVVILFDSDSAENHEEVELMFINIDDGLVPFFISENGYRVRNTKQVLVKFDDVDTIEHAGELLNCEVYLPAENRNIVTQSENSDLPDIIDFQVIDIKYGILGTIDKILDIPQNPVVRIVNNSNEILIPLNEEFIADINFDNKILTLNTPEGLIDIYMEDSRQ